MNDNREKELINENLDETSLERVFGGLDRCDGIMELHNEKDIYSNVTATLR